VGNWCNRVTLRYAGLAAVLLIALSTLLNIKHEHSVPRQLVTLKPSQRSPEIFNRTLGFQEIFAINLPARTDKKDISTLASSLTGFDITWFPGVRFSDIDDKAIPEGWDENPNLKNYKETLIGSWRAHMNVLLHIVEHNVQTALIMEDDADWDIAIKEQLSYFAIGVNALQNERRTRQVPLSLSATSSAPYGSDWDVIWLGHNKAGPDNTRQPVYVATNDITVPPVGVRHAKWRQSHIPAEAIAQDTRLIFRSRYGTGTFAYAVTLSSARKLLASLMDNHIPYDFAISEMCHGNHIRPFDCYAPYPPLMSTHRPAGSANRDSDINPDQAKPRAHPEFTWDIVYSAMQNARRLAVGNRWVQSQWPKITKTQRLIDEPLRVAGRVVWMDFAKMEERHMKGVNGERAKDQVVKSPSRNPPARELTTEKEKSKKPGSNASPVGIVTEKAPSKEMPEIGIIEKIT
jgi:GR25 family glycosyltransferase involved in LPS biosynthesis